MIELDELIGEDEPIVRFREFMLAQRCLTFRVYGVRVYMFSAS